MKSLIAELQLSKSNFRCFCKFPKRILAQTWMLWLFQADKTPLRSFGSEIWLENVAARLPARSVRLTQKRPGRIGPNGGPENDPDRDWRIWTGQRADNTDRTVDRTWSGYRTGKRTGHRPGHRFWLGAMCRGDMEWTQDQRKLSKKGLKSQRIITVTKHCSKVPLQVRCPWRGRALSL